MSLSSYLTLADASSRLPKPVTVRTMNRWATKGYRGAVLRTVKIGSQRVTREEWVEDFIQASSDAEPEPPKAPARGKAIGA